jgi:hypothetical protein
MSALIHTAIMTAAKCTGAEEEEQIRSAYSSDKTHPKKCEAKK